jgi:hypothetical protein
MKLVIGLVGLLLLSIVAGTIRWLRGGRFLPENDGEPRSLHELVQRRRAAEDGNENSL